MIHCVSLKSLGSHPFMLTAQKNRLRRLPAELGSLARLAVLSVSGNRLHHLPMSLLKLGELKALWLAANQSQPLTPLVKTYDPHCGANVLTCYLLPQTPNDDRVSASSYEADDRSESISYKQKSSERPKIRFSINPITERQHVLFRAPTPYPKKLRELAKTARAIASQATLLPPEHPHPEAEVEEEARGDTEPGVVVVGVSGANAAVDQVRTAVVKRQAPPLGHSPFTSLPPSSASTTATREGSEEREGGVWRMVPPPYHVAAAFSKQASLFQNEPAGHTLGHRGERPVRLDLDTEALCSLKDELLQRLPPADCQMSQSELSASNEMIYQVPVEDRSRRPITNGTREKHAFHRDDGRTKSSAEEDQEHSSDVDSAFVDNIDTGYKRAGNSPPDDGTYSAYPGIVIADDDPETPVPFDSSSYPISKVNSWLSSKTKSPSSIESGCEFINMYPCENNGSFQSDGDRNAKSPAPEEAADKAGKMQEEFITSSIVTKPSTLPWLFGVHKNPKVVEVTINNSGADLGFDITVLNSGVFVCSVTGAAALRPGDKILQVEGADATAHARSHQQAFAMLAACRPPFTVLVSRQP